MTIECSIVYAENITKVNTYTIGNKNKDTNKSTKQINKGDILTLRKQRSG